MATEEICSKCSSLDIDKALCSPEHGGAAHLSGVSELVESATAGCSLCAGILERLQEAHGSHIGSGPIFCNVWNWSDGAPISSRGSACIVFYSRPEEPARSWSLNLGIYVEEGIQPDLVESELAKLKNISGRPVEPYADTGKCYALASQWLESCIADHGLSCPVSQSASLPTRVLDVSGNREMPRPVANDDRAGEWVALSHCWGTQTTYVTTTSNLEQMQQGIPFEALPATFQDAITVTQRLGYQYLWIDSLCILQDSKDDWTSESARMQHYYKFSALTIAVDDATGNHEGFLSTPRAPNRTLATIPFHTKRTSKLCYAYIRQTVEYTGQEPKPTHLSQRAWTLQEDLLSPRTLHFSSDYLAWECQGHRITEADLAPRAVDEGDLAGITKRFFLRPEASASYALVRSFPSYAPYFEPLQRWYNILEGYCQRKLTFEKDRSVAILGVAQEIQAQTGMTYLSGLWREDLLFGLLWQVDGRGNRSESGSALPAWSWASLRIEYAWGQHINSLVQIYYGARQLGLDREASFRAEILEAKGSNNPDSMNDAGSSTQTLRLRSRLLPLSHWAGRFGPFFRSYWRRALSHGGWYLWEKAEESDRLIRSFDEDPDTPNSIEEGVESDDEDEDELSEDDDGSTWDEEALKDVVMLQIAGAKCSSGLLLIYGLLLKPIDGKGYVFRRVGLVEIPGVEDLHSKGWETRTVSIV